MTGRLNHSAVAVPDRSMALRQDCGLMGAAVHSADDMQRYNGTAASSGSLIELEQS